MDLVAEDLGEGNYLSPLKKDTWIYNLFEKAIGGFYRHHLINTDWKTETGRRHSWPFVDSTAGLSQILPKMITDIELTNHSIRNKIIIDTKFTKIVKPGRFRDFTLSSGHIYQLYTYLRTGEEEDTGRFDSSSGLLLYPAYGESFYEETFIQGHKCVFATVNLLAEPNEIRNELLNLLNRVSGDGSS
jgi:5-methylcytosine-specific restriction enzyme subunit McrC